MQKLLGTGVALVTPFNKDLEIDFDGLKNLLDFTAKNGADYYVVLGTTGESATLTSAEKAEVLAFVKKNNSYQLPLVYGIGGNNTDEIIRTIGATDFEGVDAILSVSPYYNKPSQEGIIAHYKSLAAKSPKPIIMYNVPGRTSSNISAQTTLKLSSDPNIIGVKESSGDIQQAMTIMKDKPKDFLLISGEDMLSVPLYAIGGSGVISVLANGFSHIFKAIFEAVKNKDFNGATEQLLKLLEINPLMYQESNPVGIKQVLKNFGICQNHVRLPLLSASDELQRKIDQCMSRV